MSNGLSIKNFKGHETKTSIPTVGKKEIFSLTDLIYEHKVGEKIVFLGGREFVVDFLPIVKVDTLKELSDNDLIEDLEKISAFRLTIASSIEDLNERIGDLEENFEFWKAPVLNALKKRYTKVTDKQLLNEALETKKFKDEYQIRTQELRYYKKIKNTVEKIDFILAERTKILMAIIDRRSYAKRGKGLDTGV